MQQKSNHQRIDLKIGELLVQSKILTQNELEEALITTKNSGLPVGRVLLMAGFVNEQQFHSAVQAQSLIRDSILPLDSALKALELLADSHMTFDQALSKIGWSNPHDKESNRLGELLLLSGVVPQEPLQVAIETSQTTGLPLGRLLVSLGLLSEQVLATALTTQAMIRSDRIGRQQGIDALKAAHSRRASIENNLKEQFYGKGPLRPSILLGELLIASRILLQPDLVAAVERSIINQRWLGEELVDAGLIDQKLLETALSLQEMVFNETLTKDQAIDRLARIQDTGAPLAEALAFVEVPADQFKAKLRFHDLLRVAGVIGQPEVNLLKIEKGKQPSSQDALETADQLLSSGAIDDRTYLAALRCYFLLATGWLETQQAIVALNHFQHRMKRDSQQSLGSLDDALMDLKWTLRCHVRAVGDAPPVD